MDEIPSLGPYTIPQEIAGDRQPPLFLGLGCMGTSSRLAPRPLRNHTSHKANGKNSSPPAPADWGQAFSADAATRQSSSPAVSSGRSQSGKGALAGGGRWRGRPDAQRHREGAKADLSPTKKCAPGKGRLPVRFHSMREAPENQGVKLRML